ncbi:hypothetical protein DM860_011548 [Cuscuta australis]|uniref:FAR1 domain-containing protein n=1 Tax=Cuscuta australis TaxID=267555 RepID=A0A328D001_9ASTE|nr:hypothetical protein DM860_011548 [Cuscuta australis]
MVFKDLDDAIRFYRAYAAEAGFDVRKTTTTKKKGSVVWQYIVCSREGKKHVPEFSHNDASHYNADPALPKPGSRRRISKRIGSNIGTMKSYRLFKESVGGYSNVGATAVDFKNFKRNLKAYIADGDAQMVIDKLFKKSEVCPGFWFDYEVDEHDQLSRLFWCDAATRKSYSMFGDAVLFDATYKTNWSHIYYFSIMTSHLSQIYRATLF